VVPLSGTMNHGVLYYITRAIPGIYQRIFRRCGSSYCKNLSTVCIFQWQGILNSSDLWTARISTWAPIFYI